MKDLKRGLWLVALGISLFVVATYVHAEVNAGNPKTDVRGCYCTYLGGSGKFLFEPFLKTADKESPSEEGESEVWGFRVWNFEPPDRDGKTHPVNIPDSRWIPLGTFKEVRAGTARKSIKCPDGLWPTQ